MTGLIRVLHVDDDPGITELTADLLVDEDGRFSVETALNAEDGLEKLGANDFDCVVSDYEMPGEDGIEFLREVRETCPDLPFILFTGKGSEEVAAEAISAGVSDYLQKDHGLSVYSILANRIDNLVDQYRSRRSAEELEQRLSTLAEAANDILWLFTADWNELLFVNSQYEEIWGRPISELQEEPTSFVRGIHPDDHDHVREAMEDLSNGAPVDLEYRVNESEEFSRCVWVQGEPVFDDEREEVVQVAGFARDVTEWKSER